MHVVVEGTLNSSWYVFGLLKKTQIIPNCLVRQEVLLDLQSNSPGDGGNYMSLNIQS